MERDRCDHKIKRIFSHGKKTKPMWICKRCDKIISRNEYKKQHTDHKPKLMDRRKFKKKREVKR